MRNFQLLGPSSIGTQKCLIPFTEFVKADLRVASVVQVRTCKGNYICNVYPRRELDGNTGIVESTVQVCDRRQNKILRSEDAFCESPAITALDVVPATRIVVTIVTKSFRGVEHLKQNSRGRTVIRNLLAGKMFCRFSAVNYGGSCPVDEVDSLLVLDCKPATGAVYIKSKTEIRVESIMSRKWYDYQNVVSKVHLGGLDEQYEQIKDLVVYRLKFPEVFSQLKPPRGIMLHGPPGTGKSSLVFRVCEEFNLYLIPITCKDLSSSEPGGNEANLRSIFNEAVTNCHDNPTIVFLDDVDSLFPKRGFHSHTNRLVVCLLDILDEMPHDLPLVVLASTSRPEDVDPSLRRPGRLDREIFFGVPNAQQREQILQASCRVMQVKVEFDLQFVADMTPGSVGADLNLLCHEAAYIAQERGTGSITCNDFRRAASRVRPSSMRSVSTEFRKVTWEQVGGLDEARHYIQRSVEWPLKYPECFRRLNVPHPKGVLVYGPPGCGKSLLVRAAATCCNASFLSVSAAELFSPYVGDSEKMVSQLFRRARLAVPCILFLDELDAMVGGRNASGSTNQGRTAQIGVIATLLQEMDGISSSQGVVVVAATNRPDKIDAALLRPGRFDSLVFMANPDQKARLSILQAITRKMPVAGVHLETVAERTDLFSGADLESLAKEAALCALEEDMASTEVLHRHFDQALLKVPASLSSQQMRWYRQYQAGNHIEYTDMH